MKKYDWYVEQLEPLYIRYRPTDDLASGHAAKVVIQALRMSELEDLGKYRWEEI